jgi:5-methylcytosine-specific restriction endonuclease McrA
VVVRDRRKHPHHGKVVYDSRRWRALRYEVLRRDGFACTVCGARGRLEVDHVLPVKHAPDRAYDLTNLQSLCPCCHTQKTRRELGQPQLAPARLEWRRFAAAEIPSLQMET